MLIVADHGMVREYIKMYQNLMRFQPGIVKGGTLADPEFEGIQFKKSPCTPYHRVFFITPDSLAWYEAWPLKLMDEHGTPLRWESGKDNYIGHLTMAGDIGSTRPLVNTQLVDLNQTVYAKA